MNSLNRDNVDWRNCFAEQAREKARPQGPLCRHWLLKVTIYQITCDHHINPDPPKFLNSPTKSFNFGGVRCYKLKPLVGDSVDGYEISWALMQWRGDRRQ
jgi:hypothetical protein